MKLEGVPFTNSATCHGVSFAAEAPVDLAEITIDGRYPETGWARNRASHEMVRILKGVGGLALRSGQDMELAEGDVVHISPGEWFAWSGRMTILMACSPPFDPAQYETRVEVGDETE